MLDTSALIGLHEAPPEIAMALASALEQFDDGTMPKTHQVVLGELSAGVLAVDGADGPNHPRRLVLDTATGLDIETIEGDDAGMFGRITRATNRTMSHNDRWICAAAIRTRAALLTQDADMAKQLARFMSSLDLLDALLVRVPIVYVPRDPGAVATGGDHVVMNPITATDEIEQLLEPLDDHDADVLRLRFGLDRGIPRTLQQVADHLGVKPTAIARTEKRALTRLRARRY